MRIYTVFYNICSDLSETIHDFSESSRKFRFKTKNKTRSKSHSSLTYELGDIESILDTPQRQQGTVQ